MRQLKLRWASPEDSAQVVEWLNVNPANLFDPGILKYPTLQVVCSYGDAGPVAYLPMHRVMILESTAIKPGTPDMESAQALRDFTKCAQLTASAHGIKEVFFVTTDETLAKMATNHGYEDKGWKALRMKL